MRGKIHRQLMRRQRLIVVVVLLGISLFVLWAWSQQLSIPIIIGSSSALVIGALLAGGYYYKWAWTGFSDYAYPKAEGVEFYHRKTLWDWLQLLIIPSVLAGAALLFNAQSTQTQLEVTTDNQREAALQAYIDKMSELLLDGKLRTSEEGAEIRSVARTRTLSIMRQLDGPRNGILLQFLQQADLINPTSPIIDFQEGLGQADLQEANLRGIKLQKMYLVGVNFTEASLINADLQESLLAGANFAEASLWRANLQDVVLWQANLQGAVLLETNLQEATLLEANLQGAFLLEANLQGADLQGADLQGADLQGADLQGAILKDATVTPEQLAQAASLKGATMPDGSIHP